ncbi:MAG: hypothetical protein K2M89_02800 [Clostridiales bacterium]|nr:hypothetical protein [Clostridiales bacterium]
MEQNNTQSPSAAISKARCVFLGFLVVGLIVIIIGLCMANYNVSVDYTMETGEIANPTIIAEEKDKSHAESGLINVKENLSRGLKVNVDGDELSAIGNAIVAADGKATIALLTYILAIISAFGMIAIDVVQVFFHKDNKILKAVKVVCFLSFIATAACALIVYETSGDKLFYTLRNVLSKDVDKNTRMVAYPHVGSDMSTLLSMIGAGLVIIGFIAMPLARAYKKQYGKKHNK